MRHHIVAAAANLLRDKARPKGYLKKALVHNRSAHLGARSSDAVCEREKKKKIKKVHGDVNTSLFSIGGLAPSAFQSLSSSTHCRACQHGTWVSTAESRSPHLDVQPLQARRQAPGCARAHNAKPPQRRKCALGGAPVEARAAKHLSQVPP